MKPKISTVATIMTESLPELPLAVCFCSSYLPFRGKFRPILNALYKLLTEHAASTPPTLAFGKAIAYTLDNWEQLKVYLENPLLTPSNNIAENAIRPFVIGRKNWLFAATAHGAETSAVLYSLVESVKLQSLQVYDYFHYIFRKLPCCESTADYEKLLPFNLTAENIKP